MKRTGSETSEIQILLNAWMDGQTDNKNIAMMFYPFRKFEVNCSRHVLDIAPDMHFHNQIGRQSAIFDLIMKLLLVHMYNARY